MPPKKPTPGPEDATPDHVVSEHPPTLVLRKAKPQQSVTEPTDLNVVVGEAAGQVGEELRTAVIGRPVLPSAPQFEAVHAVAETTDEISPQTVTYHVVRMGLHNVPGMSEALAADYDSAEECADAVCEVLRPFEASGLRLPQIRPMLLLPTSAQLDVLCVDVGGRDYVILGPCGQGGIGSTYFVADVREPGKLLVLKRVHVSKIGTSNLEGEMDMVRREPAVLNVAGELISAKEEDTSREFTQLTVMPFHEGPSLQSLLTESPGGRLPPKVACWIALSIAKELKRVGNVWHLDIKGSNIIISPDLHAKVIDYGAGRIAPRDANSLQLGMVVQQTLMYSAPELSNPEPQATSKSDVYSLLLLLYQMLSGETAVPEQVVTGAYHPLMAMAAARRYKVGDGKEVLSILRHLNLDDAADPKGEHRSKILQATDWHTPGQNYADAGSRIRQIFNPGMQTSVAFRPDLATLIEQLELTCRELGVDPDLGPPMNEVERDETRLVGRQVTPQAVLASIVQEDADPFLARVDRTKKKDRKDAVEAVSE